MVEDDSVQSATNTGQSCTICIAVSLVHDKERSTLAWESTLAFDYILQSHSVDDLNDHTNQGHDINTVKNEGYFNWDHLR